RVEVYLDSETKRPARVLITGGNQPDEVRELTPTGINAIEEKTNAMKLEGRYRTNLEKVARQMNQADIGFSPVGEMRFNSEYWEVGIAVDADGKQHRAMVVKAGKNPSDAVADILNNPKAYSIDCQTGLNFAALNATLMTVGTEEFNKEYAGLRI